MNDFRATVLKLAAALLLAMSAAACTSGNENKAAQDTGHYDMDSRNNENASLGAKSLPGRPDALPRHDSVDKTEFHYNSRLAMNETMGDRLRAQFPDLSEAYVAITESNIYAAVKLRSYQAASADVTQSETLSAMPDAKGAAGIFGSGQGHLLNWSTQNGLTTDMQGRISAALHRMVPAKANIFVSSNPYFLRRMNYYHQEARTGASMDHFINEFNTMTHYAFPANTNGSNLNAAGAGNR
jgi:hypothetical protein